MTGHSQSQPGIDALRQALEKAREYVASFPYSAGSVAYLKQCNLLIEIDAALSPAREEDELGLFELGRSFLEEYERYYSEGAFPNFVCADSPVEIIVHLINERDEARAALSSQGATREAVQGEIAWEFAEDAIKKINEVANHLWRENPANYNVFDQALKLGSALSELTAALPSRSSTGSSEVRR